MNNDRFIRITCIFLILKKMPSYQRYIRQLSLPEIGRKGQEKLGNVSVLVVGAGGLGCPALLYLAAAGIGRIGIIDGDVVELSNLHRQVLYTEDDAGKLKTEAAVLKLSKLNSLTGVTAYPYWLNRDNAMEIIGEYDIIIDGTDNLPTRYLINDACVLLGKPFVYGSIYRFEGQVSLFNNGNSDGTRGPNYRDLFPEPPPAALVPGCQEAGVIGVLPGIIGTMQATEAIKWATGMNGLLNGALLIFDAIEYEARKVIIQPREDNPVSGRNPSIARLIDYEHFCNSQPQHGVSEITPEELKTWIDSGQEQILIDVRTAEEHEFFNIGGIHVEPHDIESIANTLHRETRAIFYCRTGRRSAEAIKRLKEIGTGGEMYNLRGGIEAWRRNIPLIR
ncbi:MAG: molybdenum cofactor biosynthesis protein MoeB [Balneolaceae bacterium]|nr:MAG: molybdenum cofactor biosynthesis protein MoeB [Balneolaceae bacterium]